MTNVSSPNGKSGIDDACQKRDGSAISDITLLELATLSSKGRIRLNVSLESFLHEVEARFVVLPISGVHAYALSDFQQLILRIQRIA